MHRRMDTLWDHIKLELTAIAVMLGELWLILILVGVIFVTVYLYK